jgi:hypothetical protein
MGTILHHTGDGWSALASPIPGADFFDVGGTSGDDVWIAGKANDRAVLVHWDGNALTGAGSFGAGVLLDLWVSSAGDTWAVGKTVVNGATQPLVLHREGGGWTREKVPYVDYHFVSVSGDESGVLWAVARDGFANVVLRRVAGEWVIDDGTGPRMLIERIHVDGNGDVWAVGRPNQYEVSVWRRSKKSGWSEVLKPDGYALAGVCGTGKDVWVAGSDVWHWNGAAWESDVPTGAKLLAQCWSNASGDVTMVGEGGTIVRHQAH